jgi:hypothetical protein
MRIATFSPLIAIAAGAMRAKNPPVAISPTIVPWKENPNIRSVTDEIR